MKERLDKFIKNEGLTPARFAEIMAVQPSSISHILGGRNKPSFDFIEKMLLRFPRLNPDWLILGKGSIYRYTHNKENPPSLFSTENEPGRGKPESAGDSSGTPQQTQTGGEIHFPPTASAAISGNMTDFPRNVQPADSDRTTETSKPAENRINESEQDQAPVYGQNKRQSTLIPSANPTAEIEQVIVLYSDKTLVSYKPR